MRAPLPPLPPLINCTKILKIKIKSADIFVTISEVDNKEIKSVEFLTISIHQSNGVSFDYTTGH